MQDMLREIRIALLEADVAIPVVKDLIARIKEKALGTEVQTSLTPGQALVGIVHDELTKVIGGEDPENVREINYIKKSRNDDIECHILRFCGRIVFSRSLRNLQNVARA